MPIDNIGLRTPFDFEAASATYGIEPFSWRDIRLVPCWDNEKVIAYRGELQNLMVSMSNPYLRVKNSLHKFESGDNYSDFSFLQLKNSICRLTSTLGIDASFFLVGALEVGLNIELDVDPNEFLKKFLSFRGKNFQLSFDGNVLWETTCYFSEYKLKVYDKTYQVRKTLGKELGKQVYRFEVCYRKKRKHGVATLADLQEKAIIKRLLGELLNIFNLVDFVHEVDFNVLSAGERDLYAAGKDPLFWDTEKKISKNGYRTKRRRYKEIGQRARKEHDLKDTVCNLITAKMAQLSL